MKARFSILLLFFSLVAFKNSPDRILSGTVYNKIDQQPLAGVSVQIEGASTATTTDVDGHYSIVLNQKAEFILFSLVGFEIQRIKISSSNSLNILLQPASQELNEVTVHRHRANKAPMARMSLLVSSPSFAPYPSYEINTETYQKITENGFIDPNKDPLSTFAVDVDGASYSNVRRFLNNGQLPPKDAVRVEEMINYFQYDLSGPNNNDPVAIHTELSAAPWNAKHRLLRIALKAKSINTDKLPSSNFVFLIDVSGSMSSYNRLPLVKSSMKMLVDQLRDKDQVAIVTYAGTASVKLEHTPGSQKIKIKDAIDGLEAGGSTAGSAGIQTAYCLAREHFIKGGNNRIILASDGDFNVGPSSNEAMETLIEKERQSGLSLSVLGFGMGNLKDSKMEILANKGHGNYAYIDNITEARKAMVTEFGATLFTIAKDVKMQVEFNPAKVQAYRLLGYENRLLAQEDFNNDQKLGGDMGTGHTVTAFYEIVPYGTKEAYVGSVDPLKYQVTKNKPQNNHSSELATIKFRYKEPAGDKSKMKQVSISDNPLQLIKTSDDFRFASAIAELGMLLRNSDFKQSANYSTLIARAKTAKGVDDEGYRAEFIRLAESAKLLAKSDDVASKD